nr:hypothetical protein [Bradyrhizobium aeschynomenes]
MERRNFLRLALGLGCVAAAGAALRATESIAAPLAPSPLNGALPSARDMNVERAVTSQQEAGRLAPEQVRGGHHGHHGHHGHGHHGGWRRRHWGWRRRHWGWRHHHRHWRRRWHRRHHW